MNNQRDGRHKQMKSPAMQPGFRLFFYLAGGVSMKLRATDGSSVALFHFTLEFKDKNKTVGVARQQLHFLCSDKENEAKESSGMSYRHR